MEAGKEVPEDGEFKVYRRRWLVLFLFCLFCVNDAAQWIQYSIITDVVVKYYNVPTSAVDWTSMIWMLVYIVLIFPSTWLLNFKGLRFVLVLGQAVVCLGSWLKVFSVSPDLFWLTFLGQTVVSTAAVYALSTSAAVAAMWFGTEQVSTATSIGVFGYMAGNAVGSYLPPLLVQNGTIEEIGRDLSVLFYSFAGFATILLILMIVFLKDKPPTPPSAAQAQRGGAGVDVGAETPRQFLSALARILRSPNFLTLTVAYGISVGVFSAILTFLNQMILDKYPDGQKFAGNIALTIMLVGLVGSMLSGYVLDRIHKYKEMCLVLFAISTLGTLAFALLLNFKSNYIYLYLASVIMGFTMIGYLPAGYEFAAELTYPESEATSVCVLALCTQILSLVFTLVYGAILPGVGAATANYIMTGILAVGTILSAITKSDLRRQNAEKKS